MIALTIAQYPAGRKWIAFQSMAFFRPWIFFNRRMIFRKLMGVGQSMVQSTDWNRYAILSFSDASKMDLDLLNQDLDAWRKQYYGRFICNWWKWWGCKLTTIVGETLLSHGSWDGFELKKIDAEKHDDTKPIAVLTRATIRLRKAKKFWSEVPPVQEQMKDVKGLLFTVGIGEMPLIRQATFSIWENETLMKTFAYGRDAHREIIAKTRSEGWYSEEMFARFRVLVWV